MLGSFYPQKPSYWVWGSVVSVPSSSFFLSLLILVPLVLAPSTGHWLYCFPLFSWNLSLFLSFLLLLWFLLREGGIFIALLKKKEPRKLYNCFLNRLMQKTNDREEKKPTTVEKINLINNNQRSNLAQIKKLWKNCILENVYEFHMITFRRAIKFGD